MNRFLQGAIAAVAATIGLFFLKFARESKDRLFAFFSAAFGVLALDSLLLAELSGHEESRYLVFLLRLAAFLLIICGIVDKNRSTP